MIRYLGILVYVSALVALALAVTVRLLGGTPDLSGVILAAFVLIQFELSEIKRMLKRPDPQAEAALREKQRQADQIKRGLRLAASERKRIDDEVTQSRPGRIPLPNGARFTFETSEDHK